MSLERKEQVISQKIPPAKQRNSYCIQSSRKSRTFYTGGRGGTDTDLGFRRSLRTLSKDNLGVRWGMSRCPGKEQQAGLNQGGKGDPTPH